MSTVLQAPLVIILFTTICFLNTHFASSNGFYSVYRRICFCQSPPSSMFLSKFLLNNSPPNSHTQAQTYLSLHPHTENPQNW